MYSTESLQRWCHKLHVLSCETVNVYVLRGLRGPIHLPESLSACRVCARRRQVEVEGKINTFFFDVTHWVIRFAVVLKNEGAEFWAQTPSWLLEYLSTSYYLCGLGRSTADLHNVESCHWNLQVTHFLNCCYKNSQWPLCRRRYTLSFNRGASNSIKVRFKKICLTRLTFYYLCFVPL